METLNLVANAETTINASPAQVWQALVDPASIKQYMFGATVQADWKEGGKITWKGAFKGKEYEDKGVILSFLPERQLQYSHWSPLSGLEDIPENYHTVTIDLSEAGEGTTVSLTQDQNHSEKGRSESEQNWKSMLASLKKVVEAVPE